MVKYSFFFKFLFKSILFTSFQFQFQFNIFKQHLQKEKYVFFAIKKIELKFIKPLALCVQSTTQRPLSTSGKMVKLKKKCVFIHQL